MADFVQQRNVLLLYTVSTLLLVLVLVLILLLFYIMYVVGREAQSV